MEPTSSKLNDSSENSVWVRKDINVWCYFPLLRSFKPNGQISQFQDLAAMWMINLHKMFTEDIFVGNTLNFYTRSIFVEWHPRPLSPRMLCPFFYLLLYIISLSSINYQFCNINLRLQEGCSIFVCTQYNFTLKQWIALLMRSDWLL